MYMPLPFAGVGGPIPVRWFSFAAGSFDMMIKSESVAFKKLSVIVVKEEIVKVKMGTSGHQGEHDIRKGSTRSGKSGRHRRGERAGNREWSRRKVAMMNACRELVASSSTPPKEHDFAVVPEVFVCFVVPAVFQSNITQCGLKCFAWRPSSRFQVELADQRAAHRVPDGAAAVALSVLQAERESRVIKAFDRGCVP